MWQPWYSLETLKLVFDVFSEYQGYHTDSLYVSVYGGLISYILTLAALNVKNALFDMSFIEENQSHNFYDYMESF